MQKFETQRKGALYSLSLLTDIICGNTIEGFEGLPFTDIIYNAQRDGKISGSLYKEFVAYKRLIDNTMEDLDRNLKTMGGHEAF